NSLLSSRAASVTAPRRSGAGSQRDTGLLGAAASRTFEDVVAGLGSDAQASLAPHELAVRAAEYRPNAVSSHRARLLPVLWHQLRSPLLGLLLAAALASYFVGERSDAVIIGAIVALSVSLGLVNEYRAEKAAEALHSQIHHRALAVRDGHPVAVDVTAL